MKKYVYAFNEGDKNMKQLLGGKGANLAEMTKLGLPVPSGFTLTTEACNVYYENDETLTEDILSQIDMALGELEAMSDKKLGATSNPLLLSVRSGAAQSMPGMMDTVLNVGLNDEVVLALAEVSSNPRFVYDSYRRFISMYADVVDALPKNTFEDILTEFKNIANVKTDQELTTDELQKLIVRYKEKYKELTGRDFSNNSKEHLLNVILSVFRSWNNDRAISYRKLNNIPKGGGTAVNVQEMVYGNMNEQSATGVVFSRNPSTGVDGLYGEFLLNAQGEDIVAGVRTPNEVEKLNTFLPELYLELQGHAKTLENHFKDMQDMEFTIENGKLFMLQTRNGKRSGIAAIKIAMDLFHDNLITAEDVISRITVSDLEGAMHSAFTNTESATLLWSGLSASPGATSGKIYFSSEEIEAATDTDKILVRMETSADDIIGMKAANAIVTGRGGMTSHAAVVARGMGKVSVTGCEKIVIDEENKTITTEDGTILKEGDIISVDGTNGKVYLGVLEESITNTNESYYELIDLLNRYQRINVIANAETKTDLEVALKNGASGIGLCRTEHMFFEEKRLLLFKQMILTSGLKQKNILDELRVLHTEDFVSLFRLLDGKSICIRYLDPPFHEFMPKSEEDIINLANVLETSADDLNDKINHLKEANPMMGNRGAHLLVSNPNVLVMQTSAIAEAIKIVNNEGIKPTVEVMIPLVSIFDEAKALKNCIQDVLLQYGLDIKIGIMIETPRAAIISHQLAPLFDFYSFGTNDLTQLTYGISRDDAGKFLPTYIAKNIIPYDPFVTIDKVGVGTLLTTTIANSKGIKPELKIGVCGEHAGDPDSVEFLSSLNLDYLSCSAFRIPLIKLMIAKKTIIKE